MKSIRVLCSLACNFQCPYCCNRRDDIKRLFKPIRLISLLEILPKYKHVCISGGEPFVESNIWTALKITTQARWNNQLVFLYTNFSLFDPRRIEHQSLVDKAKCVNIGIHPCNDSIKPSKAIIETALDYFSPNLDRVRFHIQRDLVSRRWPSMGLPIKRWTMNDCEPVNEDVFLIDGE